MFLSILLNTDSFKMLAKRRLFDTLDSLLNWMFGFYILMMILCALTFVFITDNSLFDLLQIIVNVLAGIQILAFVFQLVLSILIWTTDYTYPWGQMIWTLFRALISGALALFINLINRFLQNGIGFSLFFN